MKTFRIVAMVLGTLALISSLGALPAAAAPPTNTFPGGAAYMSGQPQPIDASSSLWYRFDYPGDHSAVYVTLTNGANSGMAFNVFTPDQIGDWWNETPIGRGTVQSVNCNNGAPGESGGCASNDLTWRGGFNASGAYYVQVINNNQTPVTAQLTLSGDAAQPAQ